QSGAIEFAKANRIALMVGHGTTFQLECLVYCLTTVPLSVRCRHELEHLRHVFPRSNRPNDRIALNKSQSSIVASHEGALVEFEYDEFHTNMMRRDRCPFAESLYEPYLQMAEFPLLPFDRIVKYLALEIVLTSDPVTLEA